MELKIDVKSEPTRNVLIVKNGEPVAEKLPREWTGWWDLDWEAPCPTS